MRTLHRGPSDNDQSNQTMKSSISSTTISTVAVSFFCLCICPQGLADPDAGGQDSLVLQNFDDAEKAREEWMTVNDNVMGGRSKGGPQFDKGLLVFSGSTNTNGGGFSSIRTKPAPVDLSRFAGLLIRLKGDGRSYTSSLRTNVGNGAWKTPFRATFEAPADEWKVVFIPFDDYRPTRRGEPIKEGGPALDVGKFESLGFHIYDKKDGPFRLEVDWIKAVMNGVGDGPQVLKVEGAEIQDWTSSKGSSIKAKLVGIENDEIYLFEGETGKEIRATASQLSKESVAKARELAGVE